MIQSRSCPFEEGGLLASSLRSPQIAARSPGSVLRVDVCRPWSADEVGSQRTEQQGAYQCPRGGRGGRDDDAGAGPSLDQAGDFFVVVLADPGQVVVDDA